MPNRQRAGSRAHAYKAFFVVFPLIACLSGCSPNAPTETRMRADLVGKNIGIASTGNVWQVTRPDAFTTFTVHKISESSDSLSYNVDVSFNAATGVCSGTTSMNYVKSGSGWSFTGASAFNC